MTPARIGHQASRPSLKNELAAPRGALDSQTELNLRALRFSPGRRLFCACYGRNYRPVILLFRLPMRFSQNSAYCKQAAFFGPGEASRPRRALFSGENRKKQA